MRIENPSFLFEALKNTIQISFVSVFLLPQENIVCLDRILRLRSSPVCGLLVCPPRLTPRSPFWPPTSRASPPTPGPRTTARRKSSSGRDPTRRRTERTQCKELEMLFSSNPNVLSTKTLTQLGSTPVKEILFLFLVTRVVARSLRRRSRPPSGDHGCRGKRQQRRTRTARRKRQVIFDFHLFQSS